MAEGPERTALHRSHLGLPWKATDNQLTVYVRADIADEHKRQRDEALHLLGLIVAEWLSDPTSVMCFDLDAIVKPAEELVERKNADG